MEVTSPLPNRRRLTWLVFATSLAINLFFVSTRGAWHSDLAGDPDEAAHAVTSLMIRDYLAGGWKQPPLAFAERYYADFPKVALGHYPPGYYLLAGVAMLPVADISTLFVLQAILGAALVTVLYRLVSKVGGVWPGLAAAGLLAVLPAHLKLMQLVMSDILVALLALAAAMLWRDYLNKPASRRALGFGMVTAMAILTKGSAMGLCAIPPLATLFSGRLALLKRPSWWLCAAPVVVLAAPWMLYSSKITAEGMMHVPLSKFIPDAASYYFQTLGTAMGWPLAALGAVGIVVMVLRSKPSGETHQAASLAALTCGTVLIILLVPAGLTERYLMPCMPVILAGAVLLPCTSPPRTRSRVLTLSAVIAAGALTMAGWPEKQISGFSEAVEKSGVPALNSGVSARWLVASDPRGEGAIIAAAAFECPQRSPSLLRVYRGSKELAKSDWMGRGYQAAFEDAGALLEHLDRRGITRVFVDHSAPESARKDHERLLEAALDASKDRWTLDFEQPVKRSRLQAGHLRIYRRL
jgi:4-amino-4-deoxy-L-arabinose transferase-like glycosyltransferase